MRSRAVAERRWNLAQPFQGWEPRSSFDTEKSLSIPALKGRAKFTRRYAATPQLPTAHHLAIAPPKLLH
jgi:hypothetical protein